MSHGRCFWRDGWLCNSPGRWSGLLRFAAALSDWAASRLCRLLMGLSYKTSTWASVSSLVESTMCPAPKSSSSWTVGSTTAADSLCRCKKWLILVTRLSSAFPEDAALTAPPPQQFKTAPPGTLTREHRTGPDRGRLLERQPEPDWVGASASPAGAALQAPVSTVPKPHPSASTHASLASLQVRRR